MLTQYEREFLEESLPEITEDDFKFDDYIADGRVLRSLKKKGFINDYIKYEKSFCLDDDFNDVYEKRYTIEWNVEKCLTGN